MISYESPLDLRTGALSSGDPNMPAADAKMDSKVESLMTRFPLISQKEAAEALRVEGNHAGRAGMHMAL